MSATPGARAYRTLARSGAAEIEVSRSRFGCRLERVGDEAAARAVVDAARHEHRDARHHCSAFLLGPPPQVLERSSDDGEPAGTAGAPMLEVLRGAGTAEEPLADVVAVVSRWFGGTLLGAGGLVRAYGDAVRAALEHTPTVRRALLREVEVRAGHGGAARVETALRAHDVVVLDQHYGEEVTLVLGVPRGDLPEVLALVAEVSAGAARTRDVGERWADAAVGSGP